MASGSSYQSKSELATSQEADLSPSHFSDHFISYSALLGFLGVIGVWLTVFPLVPSEAQPEEALSPTAIRAPSSISIEHSNTESTIPSTQKVIQEMAEFIKQNKHTFLSLAGEPPAPNKGQFFDIDLASPHEFLPENREKLAYRMTQIAWERPAELAALFKQRFSELASNEAEERSQLLALASYVGETPAGDAVKEVVLQQALLFISSRDAQDSAFGLISLETYLEMEDDLIKRKTLTNDIISTLMDETTPLE